MKILVIRTDRIGEVLLSTPILTAMKEKFPQAKISMMVKPEVKELIEGNPNVDEIIEYEQEKAGPPKAVPIQSTGQVPARLVTMHRNLSQYMIREAFRLRKILRDKNFDIAIIVNPKKEFHLAAFLAGIPIRVGFDRKWGFLLTHKVKDLKYLAQKHEVEYNLDLVRALGIEPGDKGPALAVEENFDAAKFGLSENDRIVAIHPCTSNPKKRWPKDYFAKLGDMLGENGFRVVIVSGMENISIAKDVVSMMKSKPLNLAGELTLKQLAALFKRCKLLVSSDSGPVHIAAAVGTPVVAIFGSADPGSKPTRWGPYGEGHIVIQKERLEDITPEEIFGRITQEIASPLRGSQ